MDVSDRRVPSLMKSQNRKCKGKKRSGKNSLKVVYISSPMKVKASPAQFRSLVQELTGKDSDISHYMEGNNAAAYDVARDFHEINCDNGSRSPTKDQMSDYLHAFSSISSEDTTTSSDSFLGPIDDTFISQIDEQFGGIFSSSSLSEIDNVLGSYDELL